jgi:hypothetical protein
LLNSALLGRGRVTSTVLGKKVKGKVVPEL